MWPWEWLDGNRCVRTVAWESIILSDIIGSCDNLPENSNLVTQTKIRSYQVINSNIMEAFSQAAIVA